MYRSAVLGKLWSISCSLKESMAKIIQDGENGLSNKCISFKLQTNLYNLYEVETQV